MSNQQQSASAISAEQVVEYLQSNPNFFLTQDELLIQLRIPHVRGTTISLVERQLAVLRERNGDLQQRLQHLMGVARDNDRLFDKTRRLILEMLDAQNIDELIGVVDDSLHYSFSVPFVGLTLFTDKPISAGRQQPLKTAQQHIAGVLAGKTLCGVLRPKELEFLFGKEQAKDVKSVAVAVLEHDGIQGVLAIGSDNLEQYNSNVDTLFLTYLADVLARLVPGLLASLRSVK